MTRSHCSRRSFLRVCSGLPLACAIDAPARAGNPKGSGPKGFGVNSFDLFLGRLLNHAGVRSPGVRLHELADLGIPFVRFPVSVFWPDEWHHYMKTPSRYFDLLDEVVWAAEKHAVGLVPTLIWNVSSVSDLCSEPVSAWADENSKTAVLADRFMSDVLSRYQPSKVFAAWEFANELNTYADLPNGYKWWPKSDPARGTPSSRSEGDLVSSLLIAKSTERFSKAARKFFPGTMLSGGFDAPRVNAFNLSRGKFAHDNPQEIIANQQRLNQHVDLLSLHFYPSDETNDAMMLRTTVFKQLNDFVGAANLIGKDVFIGEFGVQRGSSDSEDYRLFERVLNGMVNAGVTSAALWVYDYSPMKDKWSVSLTDDRGYQLKLISKMNTRLI